MRKIGEVIIDKRVKFKRGFQKLFLIKIKEKSGLTWKQLAESLNLCEHTISYDWKSEKSTIPFSIAKNILKRYPFTNWKYIEKNWIEKILIENWGQKKLEV